MEQRPNFAAVKDAQIKSSMEECALGMGQGERSNDAALKNVQIDPNEEDYVSDTVHTAILLMNLPLSHHVLDQNSIRLL
jgi:hypothetical protein